MPDVIFNGPAGRLEGKFQPGSTPQSPIALVLHPHSQGGGTMNNKVVYNLFQAFQQRDFATLRFNFRGVGRSQGRFDGGNGELSDAAAALDWMQSTNPSAQGCWIAGFSFGAWISMQLLMRRPEIAGFISISPPANMFDFTFLAPCPSSGLIVHGTNDEVVPEDDVAKLSERLSQQRGIVIDYRKMAGAGHFYDTQLEKLRQWVGDYLDERLPAAAA